MAEAPQPTMHSAGGGGVRGRRARFESALRTPALWVSLCGDFTLFGSDLAVELSFWKAGVRKGLILIIRRISLSEIWNDPRVQIHFFSEILQQGRLPV